MSQRLVEPQITVDDVIGNGELPMASFVAIRPEDHGRLMVLGSPADVTLAHVVLELLGFVIVPRVEDLRGNGSLSLFGLNEESVDAEQFAVQHLKRALSDVDLGRSIYYGHYLEES